jgi:hypothetical protein
MQQENAFRKTHRGRVIRKKIERKLYGDAFEIIAAPIARGIDAILGTSIENCNGCEKRREKWNRRAFDTAPPP